MNARQSAVNFIRRFWHDQSGQLNCSTKSRPYSGGPQLGVVTFNNPNGAFAAGDMYSGQLQFPARFLMLVGYGNLAQARINFGTQNGPAVYVHFKVLNLQPGNSVPLQYFGNEPWILMGTPGGSTNQPVTQSFLKFKEGSEITEFWVDADNPGAYAQAFYTFIYTNDIDNFYTVPQIA